MSVEVRVSKNFKKESKSFIKKFPSFLDDLADLGQILIENPTYGTSLGNNAYKIRFKIKSKGKGKSGGARIVTLIDHEIIVQADTGEDLTVVNLLTIYDKSEKANISTKEIDKLINELND